MRRGNGRLRGVRWEDIKSPCIKVCTIEEDRCIGCHRKIEEIRNWVLYTDEERDTIIENLHLRAMIRVVDSGI